MKPEITQAVETALIRSLGTKQRITNCKSVSGGCINQCWIIETSSGDSFFIKANAANQQAMFATEADGLSALSSMQGLRVPTVIAIGATATTSFLILEGIQATQQAKDYQESLGRGLAMLHLTKQPLDFGWHIDNFIGSTPQPNSTSSSWVKFWKEQRLGHQLKLAQQNGYGGELSKLGNLLCDRLDQWIPEELAVPSLIHGDLWSGNHIADENGKPVLVDPAVYVAHSEAEFGMISLFGGVSQEFYRAYEEILPFAEGHQDRIAIYRLYHLLNHLNIFGASYRDDCIRILQKFTA